MDEVYQNLTGRNRFSKAPTKKWRGRKGFFKGFRQKTQPVGIYSSTPRGRFINGTSPQCIRRVLNQWDNLFQFGGGESRSQCRSNSFPRFIARDEESRVEWRVGLYERGSIWELGELFYHNLLDNFGVADNDRWCSSDTDLVYSTILVEVLQ